MEGTGCEGQKEKKMKKVLFICTHNSARSQMAEGLANHFLKGKWHAESCGTEETFVKPPAIQALAKIGIDISHHRSKTVEEFKGQEFDMVVTVCDSAKETCPYFPGKNVIHQSFQDPSNMGKTDEEKLEAFCKIRDEIKDWIIDNLK